MKLKKTICEICGLADSSILHRHHIIPRCDPRCNNSNIAILCPNCHYTVHTGNLIIIGIYPSTEGRCLMWYKRGEKPPLDEQFWLVKENPLVLTISGETDDVDPTE